MNKITQKNPHDLEQSILDSRALLPGGDHYRAYVGPPEQYDFMGGTQFSLLLALGLREEDHVVDLGCGSLRAGRFLIQYLLPNHYTGIEPNTWLWREAMKHEIGADIFDLKKPRMLIDNDFLMSGVAENSADFVVAQSIYSHTGLDLFETSLRAVSRCLAQSGQFLFTLFRPLNVANSAIQDGAKQNGWFYPECVTYAPDTTKRIFEDTGLHVQQLNWFHPRQCWFRAVRDPKLVMNDAMMAALGTGKPLFDSRFG